MVVSGVDGSEWQWVAVKGGWMGVGGNGWQWMRVGGSTV